MTTSPTSVEYHGKNNSYCIQSDGYVLITDEYGNSSGTTISELMLVVAKYQQRQHGERVEARKEYNGPY